MWTWLFLTAHDSALGILIVGLGSAACWVVHCCPFSISCMQMFSIFPLHSSAMPQEYATAKFFEMKMTVGEGRGIPTRAADMWCSVLLQTVTFTIALLPAEESSLKTARGVTNELVQEHLNSVGTPLTEAIQPGATWTDVALFIDQNRDSLKPMAETKTWWW